MQKRQDCFYFHGDKWIKYSSLFKVLQFRQAVIILSPSISEFLMHLWHFVSSEFYWNEKLPELVCPMKYAPKHMSHHSSSSCSFTYAFQYPSKPTTVPFLLQTIALILEACMSTRYISYPQTYSTMLDTTSLHTCVSKRCSSIHTTEMLTIIITASYLYYSSA